MSSIDTSSKRARLEARKNPYWVGVSGGRGGISIGYRKGSKGAGKWIAKVVVDRQRIEERIGIADDENAPPGALSYRTAVATALEWGSRQYATFEAQCVISAKNKVPTVQSAVEDYVKSRLVRSEQMGKNARGRLDRHVLSDTVFAKTKLSKLRSNHIDQWRARISESLAPASINRLLNDFRAALNSAAEKHRRELPPYILAEIRFGTKALSAPTNARKQLLNNATIRSIVAAAFQAEPTGDFGRLVLLAAATGARYSQITALKVEDVQPTSERILMPASKKGRVAKDKPPIAIPLGPDTVEQLGPAIKGRNKKEPLLTRWVHVRKGSKEWTKDKRRAWGPAYEIEKHWAATLKIADVPSDTVMYALRHSSIVRGLNTGLPIRLVAALHDTSVEMIETHYSAHIVDATEDLARRAVISFS